MIKNAKYLDEQEREILSGMYKDYIVDHILRLTNEKPFERPTTEVIKQRSNEFANMKMQDIQHAGRIVFVDLDAGFIESTLYGGTAQINHIYVSRNESRDQRRLTLALYRTLVDELKRFDVKGVVARSYIDDEDFNRVLCSLGFEVDEIGAATISSGRTI